MDFLDSQPPNLLVLGGLHQWQQMNEFLSQKGPTTRRPPLSNAIHPGHENTPNANRQCSR
jgi:hypothetical protein